MLFGGRELIDFSLDAFNFLILLRANAKDQFFLESVEDGVQSFR